MNPKENLNPIDSQKRKDVIEGLLDQKFKKLKGGAAAHCSGGQICDTGVDFCAVGPTDCCDCGCSCCYTDICNLACN